MYRPSPAQRRSRTGRDAGSPRHRPGARRPAGRRRTDDAGGAAGAGGQAPRPKAVLVAQPARVITEVMVVEGGRVAGQTTPEAARKDGLTVVDLSDDWLPFVFSETPEKPQPLRPFLHGPGQRADARGQELRAPARGPFLRGVRDLPQPEPGAATAGGQEAPRLPRQGEGRGARGAVAQERDPAGRAGEDPEPQPRDGAQKRP